ncbi:DUF5994 family protein [Kitasatospora sp. NPDC049258]|uniref:DUF5994 family protein n=1 Tax=Kitasatospora sp. NPDC049258 TaxID=3155394 RepID=UPI00341969E6
MTVALDRVTIARPSDSALRLSLAPSGVRPGRLDGAWWPRSRDLLSELPSLAAELDKRWGRVTRIAVNPAQWPVIPRRIPVAGHTVHVGWFTTEQDQHLIVVSSYPPLRLDLLVVPPRTDPLDAARLMSEAADPACHRTASELLEGEADAPVGPEPRNDFLPAAAMPTGGVAAADRRAEVARTRSAAWPTLT